MSQPRKHHYCPESYLARFTDDGNKTGVLWVTDREKKEVRKSKPKEQGHQRDFYRVDVGTKEDPFFLEKEFSKIEGEAGLAIDHIVSSAALPSVEKMEYLLSFVGLLAVRNPTFRNKFGSFRERAAKMVVDIACATKERFEYHKHKMRESGTEVSEEVSFEQMRSFIERDQFSVETPQNEHLQSMMTSASAIVDLLYKRSWGIVFAKDGEFVCSDNPVTLLWSIPLGGFWRSPGFGLRKTEVAVPLSKTLALVGTFEDLPFQVSEFDRLGVANFNSAISARANRFVYSAANDFIWKRDDDKILGVQEYLHE